MHSETDVVDLAPDWVTDVTDELLIRLVLITSVTPLPYFSPAKA